jgi:hypothetical protein
MMIGESNGAHSRVDECRSLFSATGLQPLTGYEQSEPPRTTISGNKFNLEERYEDLELNCSNTLNHVVARVESGAPSREPWMSW